MACYPWCPDLWYLATLLASRHGDPTPDTIRGTTSGAVAPAATLVPEHCTAEMLSLPLLAYGYGLQLKREPPPRFLAGHGDHLGGLIPECAWLLIPGSFRPRDVESPRGWGRVLSCVTFGRTAKEVLRVFWEGDGGAGRVFKTQEGQGRRPPPLLNPNCPQGR